MNKGKRMNVENRKNVTKEKQIECKRQNIRQAKNKIIFSQRKQTKHRKKLYKKWGKKEKEKRKPKQASKRNMLKFV